MWGLTIVLLMSFFLGLPSAAFGGEMTARQSAILPFSADVTRMEKNRKGSDKGRMYVSPEGIRTESERDGVRIALLHRPERKSVATLFPDQKSYMENVVSVALSRPPLPDEPESPCRSGKAFVCRQVAREMLNGRAVIHWEIVMKGPDREFPHAHLWVDPRLRIAIRESYADGLTVELTNIQEGEQPASLFTIPEEYRKMAPTVEPATAPEKRTQ
ncbi:MAG: hypothetical protein HQL96_13630 [Magnetococcales bacterium]|nr:hypothetical protein [Magnetococcales bacterium]